MYYNKTMGPTYESKELNSALKSTIGAQVMKFNSAIIFNLRLLSLTWRSFGRWMPGGRLCQGDSWQELQVPEAFQQGFLHCIVNY